MKKIRVGIINCDTHGIYYGALMEKHDPIILWGDPIGHAVHMYFYTYWGDAKKITVPTVNGFQITKVWDKNRQWAENMSKIFYGNPRVCDNFQEISDDVDLVFIADCSGDGSTHLELAAPGLKKGIPTFVDKPFAHDVKDARKLIELANKHKVPVMSLSILREIPHAAKFRSRFTEIDIPKFGIIKGGGDTMAGHIHAISLAIHLFGDGVESVEAMGQTPLAFVYLDYGGKPNRPTSGVVLNCASGPTYHCSMYASAYSEWGAIHSPNIGDFEFPWGAAKILKKIKDMVRTGKPQTSYNEMIELIAIAAAGRISQKEKRRVDLKEI